MSSPNEGRADAALAIRAAVRRASWVGALSVGVSPWVYIGLFLVMHYGFGYEGLSILPEPTSRVLLRLALAACLGALPVAWAAQVFLARRAVLKSAGPAQRATNLSAVGLFSLTIVHVPAVVGLVYFIAQGEVRIPVLMELWAFATYLPAQRFVNRQIRVLSRNRDDD